MESKDDCLEVVWNGATIRDGSGTKGELLPENYDGRSTLDPRVFGQLPTIRMQVKKLPKKEEPQ